MNNSIEAVKVETPTEASQTKKEQPTAKSVPVEQLAREWWNTEPELLVDAQIKAKGLKYVYGSKNLTKMVTFLKDTKVFKPDIDYWMDFQRFPAKRNEDELYEDYKIRQKFQNALLKYRKEVSAFAMMHMMQKFVEEQQAKKESEVANAVLEQNKQLNVTLEKSVTETEK